MKWTSAQTKVVMNGIMNKATTTVIRRNLKNHFEEGSMQCHLSNKIAYCKTIPNESREILMTGDHKEVIKENSEVPSDRNKMFVAFSEVVEDQGEENIFFAIIFTTPAMKARISAEFIKDDATYRLTWMCFPVFILGRCGGIDDIYHLGPVLLASTHTCQVLKFNYSAGSFR